MRNGEKRYIPGTNPEWGRELPDGYDNSLVDAGGNSWDNGWNFDEPSDPEENDEAESNGEEKKTA
jgi:hypothetical protein